MHNFRPYGIQRNMPAVPSYMLEYSSEFTPSHPMLAQEIGRSRLCSWEVAMRIHLFVCMSYVRAFVRSLEGRMAFVVSLAPRQLDRGEVRWPYLGEYRSREVPKLFL